MNRYLPIAVGLLLIVGLTYLQIRMTDRLSGTNFTAEQGRVAQTSAEERRRLERR